MRNVAALLLVASLVIGYVLFVHNKNPSDSTTIPGMDDLGASGQDYLNEMKDSVRNAADRVRSTAEEIQYKYGGEASKSKPQTQQDDEGEQSESTPSRHRDEAHEEEEDEEEDACLPAFTRDFMTECEGFYRSAEDADEDLPWPRPSKNNWPCPDVKRKWVGKLKRIQDVAQTKTITEPMHLQSRLEKKALANKLFFAPNREKNRDGHPICWTQDLTAYYVDKFNVVPSEEFYYWVLEYEL